MNDESVCGLFGKLPQHADFVCHHLPDGFVEYWHSWLQTGISVSREQLGEEWLELYLFSPIWRFVAAARVCSEQAVVGVMIPSVDEVGRYFPLTVAHTGRHRPWAARLSGQDWFQRAEQLALRALDEDTGYIGLIEALEELPTPRLDSLPHYRSLPGSGGKSCVVGAEADLEPAEMALGLLDRAHGKLLGGFSLWWTEGSEEVSPCTLVCAGLPEARQFAALLDGDWQRWGWSREERLEEAAEATT